MDRRKFIQSVGVAAGAAALAAAPAAAALAAVEKPLFPAPPAKLEYLEGQLRETFVSMNDLLHFGTEPPGMLSYVPAPADRVATILLTLKQHLEQEEGSDHDGAVAAVRDFLCTRLREEHLEPKDGPWHYFFPLTSWPLGKSQQQGQQINVIAKVNGVPILESDFEPWHVQDFRTLVWDRLVYAIARDNGRYSPWAPKVIEGYVRELALFWAQAQRQGLPVDRPLAISIPFATFPLTCYLRTPQVDYHPFLHGLLRHIEREDQPERLRRPVEQVFQAYLRPLLAWALPWSTEVSRRLKKPTQADITRAREHHEPLAMPDRIVTPRYGFRLVCDVAELTNDSLAWALCQSAHGIVGEMQRKYDMALAAFHQAYGDVEPECLCQHAIPELEVKRHGFLVELFGWTTAQGLLLPPKPDMVTQA